VAGAVVGNPDVNALAALLDHDGGQHAAVWAFGGETVLKSAVEAHLSFQPYEGGGVEEKAVHAASPPHGLFGVVFALVRAWSFGLPLLMTTSMPVAACRRSIRLRLEAHVG